MRTYIECQQAGDEVSSSTRTRALSSSGRADSKVAGTLGEAAAVRLERNTIDSIDDAAIEAAREAGVRQKAAKVSLYISWMSMHF